MVSLHLDTARTWRGGQNQVLLTVTGLRAQGHQTVLVANQEGELYRRADKGPDLIPFTPRSEFDPLSAWKLSKTLRQLNPDVIHAHDAHAVAIAVLAVSFISLKLRPKLIASRRVDFHINQNIFSRWKYQQVDYFICASSMIQSTLINDGVPDHQTVVIYEGIDIKRVVDAQPINLHAEFFLPSDSKIVGNVAALVTHKGQRYLIDAAPLVVKQIPNARFIIAGQGELQSAFQQQIKDLGLEKHVILTGFRRDILSLHRAFDIFVMSSITEGLGTSLFDAMASEKPVVATRAGGIPEVVIHGQTGLLVAPRDSQALAQAIIQLLRDGQLRINLGKAGQSRVKKQFSSNRMVQETLAIYARLVDRPLEADNSHPLESG